jgi:hypothetical protein
VLQTLSGAQPPQDLVGLSIAESLAGSPCRTWPQSIRAMRYFSDDGCTISSFLSTPHSRVAIANPTGIIANAFERLRDSISKEDAHDFASTELKDVWKVVREIDAAQRKRQSGQNLRRIELLLKGIEKYAKVIEVLCNGTPFLPYVWVCGRASVQREHHWLSGYRHP